MRRYFKKEYRIIKDARFVQPGSKADAVLFGLGADISSLYPLVRHEEERFLDEFSTMNIENPEHRRRALEFLNAKKFLGDVDIERLNQGEIPANSLWRRNDSDGPYLTGDVLGHRNRFSVRNIRRALARSVNREGLDTDLVGFFTKSGKCKWNLFRNMLSDMEEPREKLPQRCQMMEDIVMAMLSFIYKGKTCDFQKGIDKYAEEFLPKRTAFKKSEC